MGEGGETEGAWLSDLRKYVSNISSAIPVEAIILYGSAARDLNGGAWSDIDVLVVSDAFRGGIPIPDRISLLLRFKRGGRIEALGYTFDELVRMVNAMNHWH